MTKGQVAVIFIFLAAAITLLAPEIVVIAAISIIGIPIAVVMGLAPALALFLGLIMVIRRLLPGNRYATFAGVLGAAGVMLVVPIIFNEKLERRIEDYIKDDRSTFSGPLRARTLAVRSNSLMTLNRDEIACDYFCQRMMLNAQVERLLYVSTRNLADSLDPNAQAQSFRMERRAECPNVELRRGLNTFRMPSEEKTQGQKDAAELLRLAIASGNCLIVEKAPLGSADAILTQGRLHAGMNNYAARFTLDADTIRADRISLHLRQNGAFNEVYRWTGINAEKLFDILLPTAIFGSELRARSGFLRSNVRANIPDGTYSGPDWSGFAMTTLGYDLALRRETAAQDTRAHIAKVVGGGGAIEKTQQQVIADYFEGLARTRAVPPSEDATILKMFADQRVVLPTNAWAAARNATGRDASYYTALATGAFTRLRQMEASLPASERDERLRAIASLVQNLPDVAIRPHRADLEWLARHDVFRVPAYSALKRLAVFGADAVPTFLFLIEDAVRTGAQKNPRQKFSDNAWQHPFLAGMGGLCLMGQAGSSAIQPLLQKWDANMMPRGGSYWRLAIATLTSIGAEPEQVWQHMQSEEKGRNREAFDKEVARARRKPDCGY
jgi:hypothetical protein